MKKSLFITLFSVFLMVSCEKISKPDFVSKALEKNEGPVTEKEFLLEFDKIVISQAINAEVFKSDEQKVLVYAPSQLMNHIKVYTEDGRLYIHFNPGVSLTSFEEVKVKIYTGSFSEIEATHAADIVLKDKFSVEKAKISTLSSANISGDIEAGSLEIIAGSSGSFEGSVWADHLKSDASSSGMIRLAGKAGKSKMNSNSAGQTDAEQLETSKAVLNAVSGGIIRAFVKNQLEASAGSAASVDVKSGDSLEILRQDSFGGGTVTIH